MTTVIALGAATAPGSSQEITPVINARNVWSGNAPSVPVADLAKRLAPILWFSPEEPLFRNGYDGPIALPCDKPGSGKVVYYRAQTHLQNPLRSLRRQGTPQLPMAVDLANPHWHIDYFFFYPQDYGGGCHSNDLESVSIQLDMLDRGGAENPRYVVALRSISGAAHGSHFFSNDLDFTKTGTDDTSLPISLLVEEGKHAVAPDRNADGHYTPGYDINRSLNDAWGIRDIFGSSQLGPSSYQGYMTKPRHGAQRFRAETASDEEAAQLWGTSYRSTWWPDLPAGTYELREVPQACSTYKDPPPAPRPAPGCKAQTVSYFLKQKGIREPRSMTASVLGAYWDLLKSIRGVYENDNGGDPAVRARFGFTMSAPVWEVPMIGGALNLRQTVMIDAKRGDVAQAVGTRESAFEVQVFYSPSVSRRFDWYAGGGGGFDTLEVGDDLEAPSDRWKLLAEAGIQFRWHPGLLVGVGIKVDTPGRPRLVLEVGRAGIPGSSR